MIGIGWGTANAIFEAARKENNIDQIAALGNSASSIAIFGTILLTSIVLSLFLIPSLWTYMRDARTIKLKIKGVLIFMYYLWLMWQLISKLSCYSAFCPRLHAPEFSYRSGFQTLPFGGCVSGFVVLA
jgi:hypothetical protein